MSYKRFRLLSLFPLLWLAAGLAFAALSLRDDRVQAFVQFAVFGLLAVLFVVWEAVCRRDLSHLLLQSST